jgi:hypothetical protein
MLYQICVQNPSYRVIVAWKVSTFEDAFIFRGKWKNVDKHFSTPDRSAGLDIDLIDQKLYEEEHPLLNFH